QHKCTLMGNRNSTHQQIDRLLQQLQEINNDFTGREQLSMLDIDLLRKYTIDLYDEVNHLRLVMREKPVSEPMEPVYVQTPMPPVVEEKEEEVIPQKEEASAPLAETPEPQAIIEPPDS